MNSTTRMQHRLMAVISVAALASATHCGGQVTSSAGTGGESAGGTTGSPGAGGSSAGSSSGATAGSSGVGAGGSAGGLGTGGQAGSVAQGGGAGSVQAGGAGGNGGSVQAGGAAGSTGGSGTGGQAGSLMQGGAAGDAMQVIPPNEACYPPAWTGGTCLMINDPSIYKWVIMFPENVNPGAACSYGMAMTQVPGLCCYEKYLCGGRPLWIKGKLCSSRLALRGDWSA